MFLDSFVVLAIKGISRSLLHQQNISSINYFYLEFSSSVPFTVLILCRYRYFTLYEYLFKDLYCHPINFCLSHIYWLLVFLWLVIYPSSYLHYPFMTSCYASFIFLIFSLSPISSLWSLTVVTKACRLVQHPQHSISHST